MLSVFGTGISNFGYFDTGSKSIFPAASRGIHTTFKVGLLISPSNLSLNNRG